MTEQEIASLIERLRTDGVIVVAGTKVSYELPTKVA
jgi:biotin operon repressor